MTRGNVVAIIDDDPAPRRGLVRLLNAAGYETLDFASLDELLHRPFRAGFALHCVILDARLPGRPLLESWGELTERVKNLPCIVVTADDSDETRQIASAINAVAFFCKPVDGMALVDTVRWAAPHTTSRSSAAVAGVEDDSRDQFDQPQLQ